MDIQIGDRVIFAPNNQILIYRRSRLLCKAAAYGDQHDIFGGKTAVDRKGQSVGIQRTGSNSDTPEGSKWITIHPHGKEEKGVPLLIKPQSDGTATVIGGAGGELNQLRLSHLKSPDQLKEQAEERKRKKAEKESKKSEEQKLKEKEQRQKKKEWHQTQKQENAAQTIDLLETHGIDHGLTDDHKNALSSPPDEFATPEQIKEHRGLAREAVKTVKKIQQAYEHKLVTDHQARSAAKLNTESLGDVGNAVIANREHTAYSADGEDVSSVQQLPTGDWIVISEDESQPNPTFSSWNKAAKYHVGNVEEHENGQSIQDESFYNPSQWIREPVEEDLPEGFTFNSEVAADIAKLSAERKEDDSKAKNAESIIRNGGVFPPPYSIEQSDITNQSVLESLESDAKVQENAIINNNFLEVANGIDLKKQMQEGGYSALANFSSDVLKQNTIDRGLSDAIGHSEAAKLIAYQIRQNTSPEEYDRVRQFHAKSHAENSVKLAAEVTEQAQPILREVDSIHNRMLEIEQQAQDGYSAQQQLELDNLTFQAEQKTEMVNQMIGQTLGQLQAEAALVLALDTKPNQLSFAGTGEITSVADLIPSIWNRKSDDAEQKSLFDAYDLTAQDFTITGDKKGQSININESGMAKLSNKGFSPRDRVAYQRAINIKRGNQDESNWLPAGFSYRPKHTFSDVKTDANHFDTSLNLQEGMSSDEIGESIRGYIGARVANGDNPLDVRNDLFSVELQNQLVSGVANSSDVLTRFNNKLSQFDKELFAGKKVSDKQILNAYQELGNQEAAKQKKARATDDLTALDDQELSEEISYEAAHRTLAAMPLARSAIKPFADLNGKERRYLREYGITKILGEELEQSASDRAQEKGSESKQIDMFGQTVPVSAIAQQNDSPELNQWERFSSLMGGDQKAYEAVRDRLRGEFINRFAGAYSSIAGKPLATGQVPLQHYDRQLIASLPDEKKQEVLDFIQSRDAGDRASIQNREGGKFAVDSELLDKVANIKGDNRQLSLIQSDTGRTTELNWQRATLGEKAEQSLDSVLSPVVRNFEQINYPIKLYPEEDWGTGNRNVVKQRAIKLLEQEGKIGLHFGAGSGKSSLSLGAFTHLHAQGKVKKGIMAVPSSILSQFVGESATFLEPGKYNYSANLGMNQTDRLSAIADPDLDIHFTTRESLANDLLSLVEKHTGVSPDDFTNEDKNSWEGRRDLMGQALKMEGINPQDMFINIDEGHDITSRRGMESSKRAAALKSLVHNVDYALSSTATPVKNSLDEAWDMANTLKPDRHPDRDQFIANYGLDTPQAEKALQREIAPFTYSYSIPPMTKDKQLVKLKDLRPSVAPSENQLAQRQRIIQDYQTIADFYSPERASALQTLRQSGEVRSLQGTDFNHAWEDEGVREAVERLAGQGYQNLPDTEKQNRIGGMVMGGGALKNTSLYRLYHNSDYEDNPKMQHALTTAKESIQNGKPSVVFSGSEIAARKLMEEAQRQGLRVGFLHGGLDSEKKGEVIQSFSPADPRDRAVDLLVATDAAQTGVNLQSGKSLIHLDIPQTAKAWTQRTARIFRRGQTDPEVTVHTPLLDVPEDKIALARLERKSGISDIFESPTELLDDSGLAGEIMKIQENQKEAA